MFGRQSLGARDGDVVTLDPSYVNAGLTADQLRVRVRAVAVPVRAVLDVAPAPLGDARHVGQHATRPVGHERAAGADLAPVGKQDAVPWWSRSGGSAPPAAW